MENLKFTLKKKTVTVFLVMIAVGVLSLAYGFLGGVETKRIAANLLLNNYYFLSLGLIGLFFVTVHTIAESGWQTSVQRVAEAMSAYIPVGGVLPKVLAKIHFLEAALQKLWSKATNKTMNKIKTSHASIS